MNSIGTMIRGKGIKRCEIVDEGLPCIRYGEIYTSYNLEFRKVFSKIPQQLYDSCKKIKHGDLIFTLTGENKPDIAKTIAYLGDTEIAAGGDLAIWSNHHMNPLYLSYLLYSPYMISKKISLATGDIIVHISVDKVGSFLAPIPPLEEQNKIVNRLKMLESLISKYSEKENELYALNSNIKEQLKKSILQYAIEGKLIPQDPNDEPASVLLDRIRKEKQNLIAEGKIKKDKNESIIYRRDNSYYEKIGKKNICIDEEIPFEIPVTWEWCRLKNVSVSFGGYAFKSTEYTNKGIRVIRISDFNNNGLISKEKKYYNDIPTLDKYIIYMNDILLCMTGGTVGKACIVKVNDKQYLNQRVASIRVNHQIDYEYIYKVIISSYIQNIINDSKTSTNDNISMDLIDNFLIPLPPYKEQVRICEILSYI